MKKSLLGSTALFSTTFLSMGLAATAADASEGIKLSLGGFFRTTYMLNFDDDGAGELGNDRNTDALSPNGEIHFKGEATLDNGLTLGVQIELEAEEEGDQIDESFAFIEGGFGQLRLGNDDSALENACITPPGLSTNFSAFSPDYWAANDSAAISSAGAIVAPTSNSVCLGVDGDATKMVYYSPDWGGFSFALSYAPDGAAEGAGNSGGHNGMGARGDDSSQHNVSAYLTYAHEGEGWGLTWGGGVNFEGRADGDGAANDDDEDTADFYQSGLVLTFGDFALGGAVQYYRHFGNTIDVDAEGWVAGGGASYTIDALTLGLQYSRLDFENETPDDDFDVTRDRVVATAEYAVGPGISLDASLGYTWVDVKGADAGSDADAADDYDAFEIGIGTAFNF